MSGPDVFDTIRQNLSHIHSQMTIAAEMDGRKPEDVTLIAVSKKQPDERIDAALAAGQRVFGENRVQEAQCAGRIVALNI